jgi:NDP-sugar pyrophosphorylase family protein
VGDAKALNLYRKKKIMDMDLSELKVISPIGGEAKRLKPLTVEISKACVRMVCRPLIEIPMLCLALQGVKTFILGVKGYLNYKSLHDYFSDGRGFSAEYHIEPRVHVKYQPNENDIGSADSLRINYNYYDIRDPVFIMQSDNIFDLSLRDFTQFHERKGALMTIVLKEVKDTSEFGVAVMDKEDRIERFLEKPKVSPSNLANTGLYLISPEMREILNSEDMKEMRKKGSFDIGSDLIPYLIEKGYPVYGYVSDKLWFDVGSPSRYLEATKDILKGKLGYMREFDGKAFEGIWIGGQSKESLERREMIIDKSKRGKISLESPVLIGRHCQIDEGARISNSVIDNFSIVGKDAIVENSVIMDRVIIEEGAIIKGSIIGRHCTIKSTASKPTVIEDISVIGDDVTVGSGYHLKQTRIWPHIRLPSNLELESKNIVEPQDMLS